MVALDPLNRDGVWESKKGFYVERLSLNDLCLGSDVPWIDHHHSKKGKSFTCRVMTYHGSSC